MKTPKTAYLVTLNATGCMAIVQPITVLEVDEVMRTVKFRFSFAPLDVVRVARFSEVASTPKKALPLVAALLEKISKSEMAEKSAVVAPLAGAVSG